MTGLTIGLAFGLAAAGGIAFPVLNFGGQLTSALTRGWVKVKDEHMAVSALKGILGGAALGLALGTGVDYLDGDEVPTPMSVADKCALETPAGSEAVLGRDALGNMTCTYK